MDIIHIRLKQLRKQNNLSQAQLAKIIGVTQSCVTKWENGKSTPNVKTIILLSKLFGKKVDYLIGLKK